MMFPKFNDVRSKPLRDWNRLNVVYNIKERLGDHAAAKYGKAIGPANMKSIIALHNRVLRDGYENVRRELIRSMG